MRENFRFMPLPLAGALGALVLLGSAGAQPCPPTSPPTQVVTSYAVTMPPYAFSSIAGLPGTTTVFTGTADDNITNPAAFPFPFITFDGPATTYQISANGFVDFNQSYFPGFFFGHPPIPFTGQPNGWATPWYEDLWHTTSAPASNTYMLLTGSPGSQLLIVEWNNLREFPNPGGCVENGTERVTMQIVLHESGSVIDFKYDPAAFNLGNNCWGALIGVEDLTGTQGIDPTGMGPLNATIPATDFTLTPTLGPGPPPMVQPTYSVSPRPPGFTSIIGNPGTTVVLPPPVCPDDSNSGTIPIPFPFDFFTLPEGIAVLNANGFLTFDNTWTGAGFTNILGSPGLPNRVVAPFWDDLLHADANSTTSWLVSGSAPNREFIAQWTDLATWQAAGCLDTGTRFTFQAALLEGSMDIEFRYGPSNPVGTTLATASIGVEDVSGLASVDATGLGGANSVFPATNLRLDPCEPCGSIAAFGPGCPTGGGGIPVIGTSGGAPTPGNASFAVTQTGGPPSAPAFFVIGFSKNAWGALPLPLNLAFLNNPACALNVSLNVLVLLGTNGAGSVSVPIAIPPTTPSCSAQAYFQWADVDVSLPPPSFLAMSRGLWVTIG